MRRFLEFKGQSFHLDYDGADFVIKTKPHPFLLNLQRAIGVRRSWRATGARLLPWNVPSAFLASKRDTAARVSTLLFCRNAAPPWFFYGLRPHSKLATRGKPTTSVGLAARAAWRSCSPTALPRPWSARPVFAS